MQQIPTGARAHAVLTDPTFVVPPVPAAPVPPRGMGWLRASVARFSTGEPHRRRRALAVALLDAAPPASLRGEPGEHPVVVLARALRVDAPVELIADVAQAYQPGTGDEARADAAVDRLVALGGSYDEAAAARIGVLVQACTATADLVERARHASVDEVLRDDPPVRATKRLPRSPARVGGLHVEAGEVVLVGLAGDLAFGAGPHRCPGRAHALALVEALSSR